MEDKSPQLERLSGILKGIIIYKQEQELLRELIKKYKSQSMEIFADEYGYGFCTITG